MSDHGPAVRMEELPCGCQDVHYADGTVDHEHDYVECDGLRHWLWFMIDRPAETGCYGFTARVWRLTLSLTWRRRD